jgi:hypothetical protein
MPIDHYMDYTFQGLMPIYGKGSVSPINCMPNLSIAAGQALGQVSAASATEVQTITLGGGAAADLGGTFTLSIVGEDGNTYTTGALAYNIGANDTLAEQYADLTVGDDLQTAIRALLFAAGYDTVIRFASDGSMSTSTDPNGMDVTVTYAAGSGRLGAWTVTFTGLAAGFNMPQITGTSSLTGTTPSLTLATGTAGVAIGLWGPYDNGASDGRQVCRAFAQYAFQTDEVGRVIFAQPETNVGGTPGVTAGGGPSAPPEFGNYTPTAPAFFKGRFKLMDLSYLVSGVGGVNGTTGSPTAGLDANGIADVGRLESGVTADGANTNAILTMY